MIQRREASALLAGCHEPWRRQRPDPKLLARPDWHRLLPLVAHVQHQRPDMALLAVLTDWVASARHLSGVLAWRLWRLLRAPRPQKTPLREPLRQSTPRMNPATVEDANDWHQHRAAVRVLGGPAAVRTTLADAGECRRSKRDDHRTNTLKSFDRLR